MQALMHDQPQPACGRVENNSADCHDANHHGSKYQALREWPLWREHFQRLGGNILWQSFAREQ